MNKGQSTNETQLCRTCGWQQGLAFVLCDTGTPGGGMGLDFFSLGALLTATSWPPASAAGYKQGAC